LQTFDSQVHLHHLQFGAFVVSLFESFVEIIASLTPSELEHPGLLDRLVLDHDPKNPRVRMAYSPFDHVNASAKLAIVGITPGRQQASNALKAAKIAIERGAAHSEAAAESKVFASFSGTMRVNLIAMLDEVGIADALGVDTTARLWQERNDLVHFTSAIRYPVFVDGKDWSGSSPNALRSAAMRSWLKTYTGEELKQLRNAMIVPLGGKVTEMLMYLADKGLIRRDHILAGLPHPSGANAERISYFLGRKPKHLLSAKTNADMLDTARQALIARVAAFS
jgi:hypothetical protein